MILRSKNGAVTCHQMLELSFTLKSEYLLTAFKLGLFLTLSRVSGGSVHFPCSSLARFEVTGTCVNTHRSVIAARHWSVAMWTGGSSQLYSFDNEAETSR